MCTRHKQNGISLIELIMFIVIVSVALAGILLVMNVTTKGSADPLIHKQALAIAEALLEEVELMPFTYCDPDDPAAASATSTASCAQIENLGPEAAFGTQTNNETRYGPSYFDNVNDYAGTTPGAAGFTMNAGNGGIKDITGTVIAPLSGYSAVISMTQPGLGTIAGADTLLINVTVTGPDNLPVTLEGYRTRYSPRAVP
jgi:MSHA pilin protein MshD